MIGDSTSKSDVDKLMGDVEADLVFTSPPYDNQRDYDGDPIAWPRLMTGMVGALPTHQDSQLFFNLGIYHTGGEWVEYWHPLFRALEARGWRRFAWNVWDQTTGLPGDWNGRFAPSFEFVFHFNKVALDANKVVECKRFGEPMDMKSKGNRTGMRDRAGSVKPSRSEKYGPGRDPMINEFKVHDNVIRVLRATSQGIAHLHPAIYPIGLPQAFIESYTAEGGIVYDPFLGSGTTILACEESDRNGYGMEISPGYAAIALERLDAAGLDPKRCG